MLIILVLTAGIAVGRELELLFLFYCMIIYCLPVIRSDLCMRSGLFQLRRRRFTGCVGGGADIKIMHHFPHTP